MTAPTLWYVPAFKKMMDTVLALGTPKAMFLSASYVLDQDNHDYINDVNAFEVTGTGVPAGGYTLVSPVSIIRGTTNIVDLDANDITGINVNACYLATYVQTGSTATSPLLTITDLSEGNAVNSIWTGAVFNSNGIAGITAA